MRKQKLLLIVFFVIVGIFIAMWYFVGCPPLKNCPFMKPKKGEEKIAYLTLIGPWDNAGDWQEIISRFNEFKKRPENGGFGVDIKYEKINDPINYEDIIRERQFEGNGPNIFMVFNSWVLRYKNKTLPMPENMMSLKEFETTFPRAAKNDLVSGDRIYALPLYIDTLILYYNEDMFFNADIINPPQTWEEFKDYVERLTVRDKEGNIIRAGAAFGGGSLINRSPDIVMLLVMQNNISNSENTDNISSLNTPEAAAAVKFYTDFANPQKRFYTWNEDQIYSIDMFTSRKAAMMINYPHHIDNITNKTGGTLNFKIAPIPQLDKNNKVNYASYWVPVVAQKSSCKTSKSLKSVDCYQLSWEFLKFAASEENVGLYLNSVKKSPANIRLAQKQSLDFSNLRGVFASQVLTAKSWFHLYDSLADKALEDMIDSIITNDINKKQTIEKAIGAAIRRIEASNYQ